MTLRTQFEASHIAMANSGSKEEFSGKSQEDPDTIENKYKVVSVLGKGKTSIVYLVKHLFLDKQLAIKLFKDKYWENQKRFTRAQREAMTCASIDHKNVVKVYDFGVTEDGAPYIVQEYISGTNLRALVQTEGTLETSRAIELFKQIARGINCLHENQVLHRDIKSENIVITHDGSGKEVVKLIDLGIARQEDKDGAIQSLTQSGQHIGSPYYISPELCHGGKIDNRSDIYSFGCVMYEVLSGNPPFRSESIMKTLEMHLNSEPASLSATGVPEALDKLVKKCLSKSPEDRYENCKEILTALDAFKTAGARKKVFHDEAELSGDAGASSPQEENRSAKKLSVSAATFLNCLLAFLLIGVACLYINERQNIPVKTRANDTENRLNKETRKDRPDHYLYMSQFSDSSSGYMFDRLTIPKKADRLFERAMKTAKKRNASPEELCMIAEMHCYMLLPYKNWHRINTIALAIEEPLRKVEDKVKEDPEKEAQFLGSIPFLYQELAQAALEQNLNSEAIKLTERGLAMVAKHPDRKLLVPLMNIQMSLCLSKSGRYEEALTLAQASEKELARLLGPSHPKCINALVAETKIHEQAQNYKAGLKTLELALKRTEQSPVPMNTDYFLHRKQELLAKLKNAK